MEANPDLINLAVLRRAIEVEDSPEAGAEFNVSGKEILTVLSPTHTCYVRRDLDLDCVFYSDTRAHQCPQSINNHASSCTKHGVIFVPKLEYLMWKLTQS